MKNFLKLAMSAIAVVAMASCTPQNGPDVPGQKDSTNTNPSDTISTMDVTSFARAHVIEHFTGEDCGYCPAGMYSIVNFLSSTTSQYIWVSHHAGYSDDEYTISGSKRLVTLLNVEGAPSISINRVSRKAGNSTSLSYHPGYLGEGLIVNDADTSLVEVVLDRTYNSASRDLVLNVSGRVLDQNISSLHLTVLVKESGLIGPQADYYYTWAGWSEFRHCHAIRAFLTQPLGDEVTVSNGRYEASFTYTLPTGFNADNCSAVAYVTDATNKPILNADEVVVVDGTKGGLDLEPEGITMVEVSDTYPEEGAPMEEVSIANAYYQALEGGVGFEVFGYNQNASFQYSGYTCFPYIDLLFVTTNSTITAGTYPINNSAQEGTVYAGYRDDENFQLGGSKYYYVTLYNNRLYSMAQWLITSGSVVVAEDGSMTLNGTTLNGSTFRMEIAKPQSAAAPQRIAPKQIAPKANLPRK